MQSQSPRPFAAGFFTGKSRLISIIVGLLATVPSMAAAQSIPDGFYYKLNTEFRGSGMKLDVINGGPKNNLTRLEPDQNVTGQFWRITKTDGGWYRLSTQFRGSKMCLDVFNGGENDNQPHLTRCGDLTGQHWKISGDNHAFRLTTEFRGPDMCLDIFNGGDDNNQPQLRQCSNVTGQAWTLTRTETAVEGFAADTKPGPAPASPPSGCKRDEVYSSSMGQCIPRARGGAPRTRHRAASQVRSTVRAWGSASRKTRAGSDLPGPCVFRDALPHARTVNLTWLAARWRVRGAPPRALRNALTHARTVDFISLAA